MILEFSKPNQQEQSSNEEMDEDIEEDTFNPIFENMAQELEEDDENIEKEDKLDVMKTIPLQQMKSNMAHRNQFQFKQSRKIMNRRYKKLQELIDDGDYFSEENIIRREPALYYLYIGKYQREPGPMGNFKMNDFLKDTAQKGDLKDVIDKFIEEHPEYGKSLSDSDKILTGAELEDAEDELIVLMHHRFLQGMDSEFVDYQAIDFNE